MGDPLLARRVADGSVADEIPAGWEPVRTERLRCPACQGTGWLGAGRGDCRTCRGRGTLEVVRA